MSTTTLVTLNDDEDPVEEVKFYLRLCSMPKFFDPWTNVVHLCFDTLTIDRRLVEFMDKFVNLPFAKDPTGDSDEGIRWIDVTFRFCDFSYDEDEFGTSRHVHKLFSALADRTRSLTFSESPDLVSSFLHTPDIEHRAVQRLRIEQEGGKLTSEEYATLGSIIDRNHLQLRELCIYLPFDEGAQVLLFGLANAINLHELSFYHDADSFSDDNQAGLITGGIDPLMQLLHNPQNQLKKLCLSGLGLQDEHLIAISEVLPASQIEYFDFSGNKIRSAGIMGFAHQLPRMHSLKKVKFFFNPWHVSESTCNTFGNALLQHVMENTCMEYVDDMHCFPQAPLLWHYLVVNRAGRRLLTSSHPIPDGLWPIVLERASDEKRYKIGDACCRLAFGGIHDGRYNAIYFLLQHLFSSR